MVREIGEGTFESHVGSLSESKCLCESACDGYRPRADQAANPAVADRTGWNWIKSVDIEVFSGSRIREIAIADAIGPLKCPAIYKVEIS